MDRFGRACWVLGFWGWWFGGVLVRGVAVWRFRVWFIERLCLGFRGFGGWGLHRLLGTPCFPGRLWRGHPVHLRGWALAVLGHEFVRLRLQMSVSQRIILHAQIEASVPPERFNPGHYHAMVLRAVLCG